MEPRVQVEQVYTLVFVKSRSPDRVLLGMKKRGFGAGKWNGYGGKVERGETIIDGARRELFEESNLTVRAQDLLYLGHVTYEDIDKPVKRVVHIFETEIVDGSLSETDEMVPRWFSFSEIPYGRMWPDSIYWLPYVLNDSFLIAHFSYKADEIIVNKNITVLTLPPNIID